MRQEVTSIIYFKNFNLILILYMQFFQKFFLGTQDEHFFQFKLLTFDILLLRPKINDDTFGTIIYFFTLIEK